MFTITTPPEEQAAADEFVRQLSPGARLTYALGGTRKYELPVGEVTLPGKRGGRVGRHKCLDCSGAACTKRCWLRNLNLFQKTPPAPLPARPPAAVFDAMAGAKQRLTVLDWGVANATLEEVFIKFARELGLGQALH